MQYAGLASARRVVRALYMFGFAGKATSARFTGRFAGKETRAAFTRRLPRQGHAPGLG